MITGKGFLLAVLTFLATGKHPLPAQTCDSLQNKPTIFTWKSITMPVALLGVGLASNGNGEESLKKEVAEERMEHLPHFRTHIDDYLQYSPILICYGLDLAGIRSKNDLPNKSAILVKGELLMVGSTFLLKNVTNQLRPDKSDYGSFPSGHTANVFAAATFLSEEYKSRIHWMPYAAYGLATGVGILRIANNKHYVSDVLFGAGLGILSMKAAYWTHRYHWGTRRQKANKLPEL